MPRYTVAELAAVFDDETTLADILDSHRWALAERARSRQKAARRRETAKVVAANAVSVQTEAAPKVEPSAPQE